MILLMTGVYLFASASEIPTGKKHRIFSAPSSSSGRNSVPIVAYPIATIAATMPNAASTIRHGLRRTSSIVDAYTRSSHA